jgi:hypothetical protein
VILMAEAKYLLRFFFEWGGGCLWAGNGATFRDLGYGPLDQIIPTSLPLSAKTLERCTKLGEWHDTALNQDYPPDPRPWRQTECDRFNAAARELLSDIRTELGAEYKVIDQQRPIVEDPDLDAYLANPKGFRRRK